MQSTIIIFAELLGPQPTQGLRRSQRAALSSCPSSAPSSPAPRLEGVSPLAWPQHKGKDQVPCLGAQTWVGAWGEVGQEGPQLPGPPLQSKGLLPALPQLPDVQPGPLTLCGCSATREGVSPLCGSMLGAGSGLFPGPLDC